MSTSASSRSSQDTMSHITYPEKEKALERVFFASVPQRTVDREKRLLPPRRCHFRADSSPPVMASPPPPPSKIHLASPSKASTSSAVTGRTYDAKLVTREMHRLGGTLAHLPASFVPGIAAAAASAAASLALPAPAAVTSAPAGDSAWAQLHVHVLPLFNGDPLQSPIEDLNTLVRRHIEVVMSRAPSRTLSTLEHDAADLISSGMITLNAKLSGIDDDKLLSRVVEIWGFFWDQVLPYVEGVFLPLQTDALLQSLHRTPKTHRPSSPTLQLQPSDGGGANGNTHTAAGSGTNSTAPIDVRTLALRAFRDQVIFPITARLEALLLALPKRDATAAASPGEAAGSAYQQPRLKQMLLVLLSQAHRPRQPLSLTARTPPPTAQERAVRTLLDALALAPGASIMGGALPSQTSHAPSFISGGTPRDRRGRVAGKAKPKMLVRVKGRGRALSEGDEDGELNDSGGETPRNGFSAGVHGGGENGYDYDADIAERERGRDLLESLRSPDLEASAQDESVVGVQARPSGNGEDQGVDGSSAKDDDELANGLNWNQAQAIVERMVGMSAGEEDRNEAQSPTQMRRRMT